MTYEGFETGNLVSLQLHFYFVMIDNGGFPGGSDGKESAYNSRDPGWIPWSGRSPGERDGSPFQYTCFQCK